MMADINNTGNNKCGEDVEKWEPSYPVGGNVNWCNYCRKQYGGFSKNEKQKYCTTQNSTSGYLPEENKITVSKIYPPLCLVAHYLQ